MEHGLQEPLSFSNFPTHIANPAPLFRSGGRPNMLKEFTDFALRGIVLDMAIGIILGVAFGKIVASFINDLLMPPLGFLLGRVDFSNPFVSLTGKHFDALVAAKAAGVPTLNYGVFFNAVFNFLIVAFAVFMLMRQVNRFRRLQATPAPPPMKECPYCCSSIPAKATRYGACTSELAAGSARA
jgi:large conductance mechanosensitive channel